MLITVQHLVKNLMVDMNFYSFNTFGVMEGGHHIALKMSCQKSIA